MSALVINAIEVIRELPYEVQLMIFEYANIPHISKVMNQSSASLEERIIKA